MAQHSDFGIASGSRHAITERGDGRSSANFSPVVEKHELIKAAFSSSRTHLNRNFSFTFVKNFLETNILRACFGRRWRLSHNACSTELRKVDLTQRYYLTNAHNRKNGGKIYNARNCGISIVTKIFLFYFWYLE